MLDRVERKPGATSVERRLCAQGVVDGHRGVPAVPPLPGVASALPSIVLCRRAVPGAPGLADMCGPVLINTYQLREWSRARARSHFLIDYSYGQLAKLPYGKTMQGLKPSACRGH